MSKIICDICGTSYPDTADQCPICGCARDMATASLTEELAAEEEIQTAAPKAGRFAAAASRKRTPVYEEEDDEDEYDDDDDDDEDEDDYDEDDYDEDDGQEHKSNAPLVILLVIVILALLAVSAFIFVRYFMPNVMGSETTAPTTVETTLAPETTELKIPCESLALTSGGEIVLEGEGNNWLINVMALPENTTDTILYSSSDESVATVNEQGKVTAVGEGTAVITILCGEQQLQCTVTCDFTPETSVPETTVPEDATDPTEPEETTEPTEPLKDITLKVLRYTDLTFNAPNQGFTFVLEGLKNEEVKWTSMDEKIVTVDEHGRVISVGPGKTTIICQYGDQKVEIKINCKW